MTLTSRQQLLRREVSGVWLNYQQPKVLSVIGELTLVTCGKFCWFQEGESAPGQE